ncbi:DUF5009 domain-containing protein [Hwangdonia seohaensis]|uniref:DUF5009 domain-containing protein n=1 Tax=Hwangdonia seohaensis TaxID=1240727 RepID=A0ABW3RDW0_9FLAO|nr:DUF5009 domain-containing protein [Hwangdonia seohaensis]
MGTAITYVETKRTQSIDVFRAVTMFLMIFVNDIPSLKEVPNWLKHTAAQEDGMGLSDVVFPLFLFIVGLSIPLAINTRRKKGYNEVSTAMHIVSRTIALLVMGVLMVNIGRINPDLMPFGKSVWQILMTVGIMLVWLYYKPIAYLTKAGVIALKCLGIGILLYLVFVFKGGTADNLIGIKPYWWGILGLIGWAYLLNAFFFMFLGSKIRYIILGWLLLFLFNIQEFGYFTDLPSFKIVVSASNHLLVMLGVLCTVLLLRYKEQKNENRFLWILLVIGVALIALGFFIRPSFIISKILATPSWTIICGGISFLLFGLFYIVVDKWGQSAWANIIKPAGTSTLTCYLLPFLIYPLMSLLNFRWPEFATHGWAGIIKSLLFALVVIIITGGLERIKIKLKV